MLGLIRHVADSRMKRLRGSSAVKLVAAMIRGCELVDDDDDDDPWLRVGQGLSF